MSEYKELAIEVCKGNLGALAVISNLFEKHGATPVVQAREVDITGPKLWIAYKDICNQDLTLLASRLISDSGQLAAEVSAVGR